MDDISGLLRAGGGLRGKVRWHLNRWLLRRLGLLRRVNAWMTVHDSFGAPGDTLLTAIVCRNIKERFPGIRINCITPNPELLRHDSHISRLNGPETYVSLRHWYLDMIENKRGDMHVLHQSMEALGLASYHYKGRVYLAEWERAEALRRLEGLSRPVITINTVSKEPSKNWLAGRWTQLAEELCKQYDLVQLGDATELDVPVARTFAGKLSLRESMAVLSHARAHIGPDSFLMHAANAVDVPSVVLFGGSRTAANSGYAGDIPFYIPMPCGPCYIHKSRGEVCPHEMECMAKISVEMVYNAAAGLVNRK